MHARPVHAQTMFEACFSDGLRVAPRLVERFIAADCEACWSAEGAASSSGTNAVVLDWITPGTQGEDAPLSAAATRDGLYRLQGLGAGLAPPQGAQPASGLLQRHTQLVRPSPSKDAAQRAPRLSIARGPVLRGHVGVSMELKPARGGPWRVWLALVEQIAAGEEGSPVARQLVRGSLEHTWDAARQGGARSQGAWVERRIMRVPEGAAAQRLQLVGWVEDAQGRMLALAQTRCPSASP